MSEATLLEELAELETAEEFLNYFAIAFDSTVVQVNRLHILQRFHDYLHQMGDAMPQDDVGKRVEYARFLHRAYQDFVESDALTEKVFKIFHRNEPHQSFLPLDEAFK